MLPSSFDSTEPAGRAALASTRAVVFAREPVSLKAIEGLCDARLALDCAFFLDLDPYRTIEPTVDELVALRDDPERALTGPLPPQNDDISVTTSDVDAFLRRDASARRVRTDRAHVMIAAALLGRSVEYAGSNHHKLPAIAEWALAGLPVTPLPSSPVARSAPLPTAPRPDHVLVLAEGIALTDDTVAVLSAALDRDPDAAAATATVEGPEGAIRHAGGALAISDGIASRPCAQNQAPQRHRLPGRPPEPCCGGAAHWPARRSRRSAVSSRRTNKPFVSDLASFMFQLRS